MAATGNFKLIADGLDVDFRQQFLPPAVAEKFYHHLEELLPIKAGRQSLVIGDPGLIYRVEYGGHISERPVAAWDLIPGLTELKNLVETTIKSKVTVCIIQRYHDGRVGIRPHKDREMVPGTKIAGLSLGATRRLEFSRRGYQTVALDLPSGSFYVMKGKTNEEWLHAITLDPMVEISRISLTFRTYRDPTSS
jgi:hypothetical protein